ncbi:hypothetical protein Pcinc_017920 [Petrolisthes cinctipes]|uniref:YqaJ viral recombinase domain-containing protein n=1 Tax=Petrolisthes cinctipes TaxID=88211 RepID=A0AAE1FNB7_PETCI|nr:hypothetical protein Pcinc_017920 [Petrolisthes cinctipes]
MSSNHPSNDVTCQRVAILPGYVKADSRNLPKVDPLMIADYYQRLCNPAMKHVKLKRSVGEDYGDDAVGYVQLQRKDGMCEITARITPEHRVTTKPYRVVAVINKKEEEILEVKCQDSAAAQGPCKHAAAFVGWLLRLSGEKSVTSVKSYCNKARLSNVTIETKSTSLASLKKKAKRSSAAVQDIGEQFFREVLALPSQSGLIYDYYGNNPQHLELFGIDQLLQAFYKEQTGVLTSDGFLQFCKVKMTSDICKLIEKETVAQSKSSLWHALRFARITASKAYSVATAVQSNSQLVMSIIGATKLKDTAAMQRGRELEPKVLLELEKQIGCIKQSGVIFYRDLPVLGASPDGITSDGMAIVEVKCPTSEKSFRRYIKKDGTPAAKQVAQVQMLMHMARKNTAISVLRTLTSNTTSM